MASVEEEGGSGAQASSGSWGGQQVQQARNEWDARREGSASSGTPLHGGSCGSWAAGMHAQRDG